MDDSSSTFEFSIVKFPDENELVAVVPSTWIMGDNCFWPPEKEYTKVGLYVRKQKDPQRHWQFLRCQELERYGSYKEARQMLPLAEQTSDLNGELQYGRGKRGKRRPIRVISSDEDSSPVMQPPCVAQRKPGQRKINSLSQGHVCSSMQSFAQANAVGHHNKQQQRIQSMPYRHEPRTPTRESAEGRQRRQSLESNPKYGNAVRAYGSHAAASLEQSHQPERLTLPATEQNVRRSEVADNSDDPQFSNEWEPRPSTPLSDLVQQSLTGRDVSSGQVSLSSSVSTQAEHRSSEFEKKVLRCLHLIMLRLSERSSQLDIVTSRLHETSVQPVDAIISEPFASLESFLEFDKEIRASSHKRELLRNYMAKLGGNSTGDRVRRILRHILTDEVAEDFNWTGIHGKRSFRTLECVRVVCSAVGSASNAETLANIEIAIKTWVRHAHERVEKKKLAQKDVTEKQ